MNYVDRDSNVMTGKLLYDCLLPTFALVLNCVLVTAVQEFNFSGNRVVFFEVRYINNALQIALDFYTLLTVRIATRDRIARLNFFTENG